MTDPLYALKIGVSVLTFLGPNLYSNIPAVLSEMVANSWDADATKVTILVDPANDTIVIEDNGLGMSLQDINNKFLFVGHQKRSTGSVTTPSGRHVMGRKGIGKLAVFSFADIFEVQSSDGHSKVGCTLSWDEIEEAITSDQPYVPTPIEQNLIQVEQGTRITLRKLRSDKLGLFTDIKALRKKLARRFVILLDGCHNFSVIVNGSTISKADTPYCDTIKYLWHFGDMTANELARFPNHTRTVAVDNVLELNSNEYLVKGWVGTVQLPSDIGKDENNTIALFAHGKLIQEDILGDYQEAQNFAQYIVGDVIVDFMDSDDAPDIVTSDRQRVNQNDPRYVAVKEFIDKKIMTDIRRKWSLWRLEDQVTRAFSDLEVQRWYNTLSDSAKRDAARILAKIDELTFITDETRSDLYRLAILDFARLKNAKGLSSIDEVAFVELIRKNSHYFDNNNSPTKDVFGKVPNSNTQSSNKDGSPAPDSNDNNSGDTSAEKHSDSYQTDNSVVSTKSTSINPEPKTEDASAPTASKSESAERTKQSNSAPKVVEPYFKEIQEILSQLAIEQSLKEIAQYDLEQARHAYQNSAHKACIVMLGAVLEGVMLGTIRRHDVLQRIVTDTSNAPKVMHSFGLRHPNMDFRLLADNIAKNLTFEDCKVVLDYLIPDIEKLKIEGIQVFRNTIHPWKAIEEPRIYATVDHTRVSNLITSLTILLKHIHQWKP